MQSASEWNFGTTDLLAIIAFLASCYALYQSHQGLKASRVQAQASIFTERYKVFTMAKDFLRPWFRAGRPSLGEIPALIDAWERSKFLFEPPVSEFLRVMWKEALDADLSAKIINGEAEGDRQKAIELKYSLARKYLAGSADEPDLLVEAFMSMKIDPL